MNTARYLTWVSGFWAPKSLSIKFLARASISGSYSAGAGLTAGAGWFCRRTPDRQLGGLQREPRVPIPANAAALIPRGGRHRAGRAGIILPMRSLALLLCLLPDLASTSRNPDPGYRRHCRCYNRIEAVKRFASHRSFYLLLSSGEVPMRHMTFVRIVAALLLGLVTERMSSTARSLPFLSSKLRHRETLQWFSIRTWDPSPCILSYRNLRTPGLPHSED